MARGTEDQENPGNIFFSALCISYRFVMIAVESQGTLVLPEQSLEKLVKSINSGHDYFDLAKESAMDSTKNSCFSGAPHISFEVSGNRVVVKVKARSELINEPIERSLDIVFLTLKKLALSTMEASEFGDSGSLLVIRDIAVTSLLPV